MNKKTITGIFGPEAGLLLYQWLNPCCTKFCDDIKTCLGIGADQDPNTVLNRQGNWITPGGGGSQNLQQVTDVGNVTTNNILVGVPYTGAGTVTAPYFEILSNTNNTLEFSVAPLVANLFYTWPGDNGPGGTVVLTNDGNGLLSWIAGGWGLTGNAGTTIANFIGTTDNVPLRFRVNNLPAGYIGTTNGTLVFGRNANPVGTTNTVFGSDAFATNSVGIRNTILGYGADVATNNTDGGVAIGYNAVAANGDIAFGTDSQRFQLPGFTTSTERVLTDLTGSGECTLEPLPLANRVTAYNLGDTNIVPTLAAPHIAFVATVGGPSVILLTTLPLNATVIVSDVIRGSATDNITVDAGPGNTITTTAGVAQTDVISSDGESRTYQRVSATQWMLISST